MGDLTETKRIKQRPNAKSVLHALHTVRHAYINT